ncbi:putative ATP-dependent RNA helicase DHX57 [Blattella germanica]|nr:putative ATP-dependent RNA helicase DHX57 [Blattella germanica]
MESLELVWVSRANALQRKGRAGRVRRGVCIHLYTRHRYNYQFLGQPIPELHRVPLEQLILRIKTLPHFADKNPHFVLDVSSYELSDDKEGADSLSTHSSSSKRSTGTIEPPPTESIDSALIRLKDVGALDGKGELTPLGRHLAALPVDVSLL